MIYNLSYRNHLFLHIILHEGILDIRTARFGVCPTMFEQLHCIKSSLLFSGNTVATCISDQGILYKYLDLLWHNCSRQFRFIIAYLLPPFQIHYETSTAAILDKLQHHCCRHFRFIVARVSKPFQIHYGMFIVKILDLFQHKYRSHLRLIMPSQSPSFQIYCDTTIAAIFDSS